MVLLSSPTTASARTGMWPCSGICVCADVLACLWRHGIMSMFCSSVRHRHCPGLLLFACCSRRAACLQCAAAHQRSHCLHLPLQTSSCLSVCLNYLFSLSLCLSVSVCGGVDRLVGPTGAPDVARQLMRLRLSAVWVTMVAFEGRVPVPHNMEGKQEDFGVHFSIRCTPAFLGMLCMLKCWHWVNNVNGACTGRAAASAAV
jgi:hypothetical protein